MTRAQSKASASWASNSFIFVTTVGGELDLFPLISKETQCQLKNLTCCNLPTIFLSIGLPTTTTQQAAARLYWLDWRSDLWQFWNEKYIGRVTNGDKWLYLSDHNRWDLWSLYLSDHNRWDLWSSLSTSKLQRISYMEFFSRMVMHFLYRNFQLNGNVWSRLCINSWTVMSLPPTWHVKFRGSSEN